MAGRIQVKPRGDRCGKQKPRCTNRLKDKRKLTVNHSGLKMTASHRTMLDPSPGSYSFCAKRNRRHGAKSHLTGQTFVCPLSHVDR